MGTYLACPKDRTHVLETYKNTDKFLFCGVCREAFKVSETSYLATPEPDPKPSTEPAVWDLVMNDMSDRDVMGVKKYKTRLKPHNGRDALKDAYQEALDLVVYLRQAIYERDGK